MILTNADFTKGQFKVPNVVDVAPDSNLLGNNTEMGEFIDEFVPEACVLTLGYDLWKLLEAELDPSEPNGLLPTADERYDKLLNGDGKYLGMDVYLIPYVYFKFLENDESHYGGVGVLQETAKGAEQFSPVSKGVKAWRTFYKNTIGIDPTPKAWEQSTILGDLVAYDWYGSKESLYTPLYQYLRDNAEIYPEAISTNFDNINYYGI